jgi:hypothetical protein
MPLASSTHSLINYQFKGFNSQDHSLAGGWLEVGGMTGGLKPKFDGGPNCPGIGGMLLGMKPMGGGGRVPGRLGAPGGRKVGGLLKG